ncbi:hypothetical protein DOTSEDRAFT_179814 [Dothistroma septosporum NZE10]|uniref:RING-type E3 ubiquitin transferase n=1 Tax=Dothistroma septosporum (strain NZE10 / CBS 128990) TaxID=675120 RepID=M2Y208_DOTSN|nr:hypothetical protein DOTSEDRAFT_179814 [Dothistroma septosporum NZE10]
MALAADTNAASAGPQNRGGHRGRGRGRGGPRGDGRFSDGATFKGGDSARADGGGRSRARGRGRGVNGGRERGNRDRGNSQSTALVSGQDSTQSQLPPQPGGTGNAGEDVEAEVCFICASPVSYNCVAPCNHRTCHICSLRMRALYRSKACAHCRTEASNVIFTDDAEKRYEHFKAEDIFKDDPNLGISYEKPEIFEDTVLLLRYNCPDGDCDVACLGWPDLHRHVRSVHQKVMCDLCTRNKKVFTHEHELFTHQELRKHEKYGDDNPGAIDQSGFKGHPECGFCRQRFYGEDELFTHCRERHEKCHLCERRNPNSPQYFQNYDALEKHFNKDHFPCLDQECQEKKFVVFDSEMDLKAHQLQEHPNGLSKDARRDARRVDISSFDYRPQYQEPRRGGRRPGRGRDPNAEAMPAASAGQMSRAELAHQREREIQSAQSVTSRSFGGQLSAPDPTPAQARGPAQSKAPASPRVNNAQPVAPAARPVSPRPAQAQTPQEQARALRHAAVTERAGNLLHNDKVKLDEFRERISSYRNDRISAGDLIDAFFALFDTSSDQLGKLIKELADIFELTSKRDALLKGWSDWKAINEDYPSLPGAAGANTTAAGILGQGVGASRVLKLKSSTAQSSRSSVGRQASWGTASGTTRSNPFPSLPPTNGGPSTARGQAPPAPTPNWLALRPAGSSASSSARPSPQPSRNVSSANLSNKSAFPSLPAAKKPTSTVFTPGYTGRGVIRSDSNYAGANAWGGGGSASNGASTVIISAEDESAGKGKGKKGKKQVLFNWG